MIIIKSPSDLPLWPIIVFYLVIGVFMLMVFSGCSSLGSYKDCGMVVDVYTKEQLADRWECKDYSWWDKLWRGY